MYTKKKCKIYVLSVLLCTFFFSCSSIDFELPQGPQGTNGKSAYEIWKEEVETGHINWPSTQVDLADCHWFPEDLGVMQNLCIISATLHIFFLVQQY